MRSKIAQYLVIPVLAMALSIPAARAGEAYLSAQWSVEAQLAAKYNCGGREYYDQAGNYYDFVPGWDFPPGHWIGPIDPAVVTQLQTHSRCYYPAIGRYLGFDGVRHRFAWRARGM